MTADYEKHFLQYLASKGSPERSEWAYNKLCAMLPRMLFTRRINFWRRVAETSDFKWRRKIARHVYRGHRKTFLSLANLGLI